jgi:hypothetical protein
MWGGTTIIDNLETYIMRIENKIKIKKSRNLICPSLIFEHRVCYESGKQLTP